MKKKAKRIGVVVIALVLLLSLATVAFGTFPGNRSAQEETSEGEPSLQEGDSTVDTISEEIEVGPGEEYVVEFDEEEGELIPQPVRSEEEFLPDKALDAIDHSPEWLEEKLTTSFTELMKQEIDVGGQSSPALGDLTDDGTEDLVVGNEEGNVHYFENLGIEGDPIWDKGEEIPNAEVDGNATPTLGDLTGDGLLDMVVGSANGTVHFFENSGTEEEPEWEQDDTYVEGIEIENESTPYFFDMTDNGLLDLAIGSESGIVHFYENVGDETEPAWEENEMIFNVWTEFGEYEGVWAGEYSSPWLGHYGDELYLYLGVEDGEVYRFRNTYLDEGNATWSNLGSITDVDVGENSAPLLYDYKGDGRRDLILGSADGTVSLVENLGIPPTSEYTTFDHEADDLPLAKLGWGPSYYPEIETLVSIDIATEYIDHYADLILETEEPYIDEVAYQVAHEKIGRLRELYENEGTHLFQKNAETAHQMAENVTYADIVEKEDYTTLEYNVSEDQREEMPKEKYYKYTIMYNRYTLSPEDWPQRTEGHFYREYLPYDDTYNVTLFERTWNSTTLYDAAYNVTHWICEDVGAWWRTGPKPPGWYNIYHNLTDEDWGIWCGEFAIIWQVAARSMLIPNLNVVALGEDHQFNNFYYDGGWIHVDASTSPWEENFDSPEGRGLTGWYENGYSYVMKWAENGRYDPVERAPIAYTPEDEEARVEVEVLDSEGRPVDGARVELWSHAVIEDYGVPLPTAITMTNSKGEAAFDPVGFNTIGHYDDMHRFTLITTSRIGSRRAEIHIDESKTYEHTLQLDEPIPSVQYAELKESSDDSSYQIDATGEVTKGQQYAPMWLGLGYESTWQFEEDETIDFYMLDEEGYQDYLSGYDFEALSMSEGVETWDISERIQDEDVYLVVSNRESLTTTKTVEISFEATLEHVDAIVDIHPETINLRSQGKWVTGYIELEEGYDVGDIDIETVKFNYDDEKVEADWGEVQNDELMVKFDRSEVVEILEPGDEVEVIITGEINDELFSGASEIRVIDPGKGRGP